MDQQLNNYTDIQIWDLIRAGNDAAFEYIYHSYSGDLFRYGQRFTPNLESIEDTIQDVFIRIWENRLKITIHKSLKLYLFVTFRRDMLRKLDKTGRFEELDRLPDHEGLSAPDIQAKIIEQEYGDELSDFLASAMKKLSKRQKEAIHLRYIDNLSYQEIAQVMDIQPATLYNMIFRAIRQLREDFERRGLRGSLPLLLLAAALL